MSLATIIITSDVSTWWLVGATGALALLTGGLMIATFRAVRAGNRTAKAAEDDIQIGHDQVDAAQRQADLALKALLADSTPMVVPATGVEEGPYEKLRFDVFDNHSNEIELTGTPIWWHEESAAWLAMRIRNVGRGPALIGRDRTDVLLHLTYGGDVPGWISTLVVAPGDQVWVAFADKRFHTEHGGCLAAMCRQAPSGAGYEGNNMSIAIRYSDISGERWTRSILRILLQADSRAQQRGVELEDAPAVPWIIGAVALRPKMRRGPLVLIPGLRPRRSVSPALAPAPRRA